MGLRKLGTSFKIVKWGSVNAVLEKPKSLDDKQILDADASNDFLYFVARSILADVPNGNGDIFPKDEVLKSYHTFVGKHIDLNHSTDPKDIIGKIVEAYPIEKEGKLYIEIVGKIDKKQYPDIARKIETKLMSDVSMEAIVESSECSICGHIVRNETDKKCEHLENYLNKECEYNGEKKKCYAINRGITFSGLGIVMIPAEPTANVTAVIAEKKIDESRLKINSEEKKWVYGTKDNKWYLVGPEDRDYEHGISQEEFKRLGPEKAKEEYLKPRRISNMNDDDILTKAMKKLNALEFIELLKMVEKDFNNKKEVNDMGSDIKTRKIAKLTRTDVWNDSFIMKRIDHLPKEMQERWIATYVGAYNHYIEGKKAGRAKEIAARTAWDNIPEKYKESSLDEEQRRKGFPRTDLERVMNHYNVSEEEAKKMLEEKSVDELLPPRGTGLKDKYSSLFVKKSNFSESRWIFFKNGNILISATLDDIWKDKLEEMKDYAISKDFANAVVERIESEGVDKVASLWKVEKTKRQKELKKERKQLKKLEKEKVREFSKAAEGNVKKYHEGIDLKERPIGSYAKGYSDALKKLKYRKSDVGTTYSAGTTVGIKVKDQKKKIYPEGKEIVEKDVLHEDALRKERAKYEANKREIEKTKRKVTTTYEAGTHIKSSLNKKSTEEVLKIGDRVRFNLEPKDRNEWGVEEHEWENLLEHDGKIAKVTRIDVQYETGEEPQYVTIRFPDMYIIEAVDAKILDKVEKEASLNKKADKKIGDEVSFSGGRDQFPFIKEKGDYDFEGTIIGRKGDDYRVKIDYPEEFKGKVVVLPDFVVESTIYSSLNKKSKTKEEWKAIWDGLGGSFDKCVEKVKREPGEKRKFPKSPESYCAWLEHKVTGEWPAERDEKEPFDLSKMTDKQIIELLKEIANFCKEKYPDCEAGEDIEEIASDMEEMEEENLKPEKSEKEKELEAKLAEMKKVAERAQFEKALREKKDKCGNIINAMLERNMIVINNNHIENYKKQGLPLIDAQHKALKDEIDHQMKDLLAMDDNSLKAFENSIKRIKKVAEIKKQGNKKGVEEILYVGYEPKGEDEWLEKLFERMD